MYHIPAPERAVTLFSRDGEAWAYRSMRAALKALGASWIGRHVGAHFREFSTFSYRFDTERKVHIREPLYREADFIMRDDVGAVVTRADFEPLIERRKRAWWARSWDNWNGIGPVPGVHKHSAGRHYFRRPQTAMERRLAGLVLSEEGEVAPRPGRNATNLVSNYDDIHVAARENRNWKQYRRNQWKEPRD